MNEVQGLIDRQLGILCQFNYDNILKRLVVNNEESFYGLQNSTVVANFDQDPPIFACRFSEAPGYEHILALANEDGKVAIQNTERGGAGVDSYQCHHNAVFDLAWMPRHTSFVTVSGDHTACLWDVGEESPRRVVVFASHTRSVKTAAFRPAQPNVFATGARDGHILVWDTRAGAQPALLLKPDNCLMNCHSTFTPKTPGSSSKRPRIDNHRATSITGLVFRDDLTLVSCGECDGNIKAWDLRKNYNTYKREPLPKHSIPYCGSSTKNGYTNLVIDDARVRLYASCMDNVIYCFNVSTYNAVPERRYVGHENSTFYIKTGLSPDCMYLVSGSSDKNAYIWNVKYSQPIVKLVGHWAEVTCAAWCQKGDTKIVTSSDDARHKIWRIGREHPEEIWELRGMAELVPHTDVRSLLTLDKTPSSMKRKQATTPSSSCVKRVKGLEGSSRKTKRCLTDLMNASREASDSESLAKRARVEAPASAVEEPALLPAGVKRHHDHSDRTPTKTKCLLEVETSSFNSSGWSYISPKAGSSFLTPTKNYERKVCRKISPKNLNTDVSSKETLETEGLLRIITFTTPTKNLPNFVLDGEAPHLRLMSPVKRKLETTDWLTQMAKEKRGRIVEIEKPGNTLPLSPNTNPPTRRNSTTDKTPKSTSKTRTLLKYFSVASKENKIVNKHN